MHILCSRYGDKAPQSTVGRILTMIWALVSMVLMAFLTSVITNMLIQSEVVIPGQTAVVPKTGVSVYRNGLFVQISPKFFEYLVFFNFRFLRSIS